MGFTLFCVNSNLYWVGIRYLYVLNYLFEFWPLAFIILTFVYVIKNVIYDLIAMHEYFNTRHSKDSSFHSVFGEVETLDKKVVWYIVATIFVILL